MLRLFSLISIKSEVLRLSPGKSEIFRLPSLPGKMKSWGFSRWFLLRVRFWGFPHLVLKVKVLSLFTLRRKVSCWGFPCFQKQVVFWHTPLRQMLLILQILSVKSFMSPTDYTSQTCSTIRTTVLIHEVTEISVRKGRGSNRLKVTLVM